MMKYTFLFILGLSFVGGKLTAQKSMTAAPIPSDNNAGKENSSSTKKSTTHSAGSGYYDPSAQTRAQIKNIAGDLAKLRNSAANAVNNAISKIGFKNPFVINENGASIFPTWNDAREFLKDDEETNDFATLSQAAEAYDKIPDSYIPDYDKLYEHAEYAVKTAYTLNDLAAMEPNEAKWEVADQAMDHAIDKVEPGLGARLRSIKEISDHTFDLFRNGMDNFFNCQSGCEQNSEQYLANYKRDVTKSFANAVAPVRAFSDMIDNAKGKIETTGNYLKSLFGDE